MLKMDHDGLGHSSFHWETGWTYVHDGYTTHACLNNCEPTPFPVEMIEVVMQWPEPHLENNGQDGADIVLRLDIGCNYTGWEPGMYPGWEHVASDMSYDTKKRIFLTPLDGVACWRVRLTPYGSVTSNPWESDEEVRKVYVAAGMNLFVDET